MAYNLRFFFNYYADKDARLPDAPPDEWDCEIFELDYAGIASEIEIQDSPVVFNTPLEDDKLHPMIGSQATLNLIATVDFALQSLYTENDRQFLVISYRNNSVVWRGFALPDNCREPFTFTPYPVSISCVDGLGLLKNLSFVQETGDIWLGKQSFLEVIYNCLNRLQIPDMVLNTCVNVYEITMSQGDNFDPLAQAYVNVERYFEDDGFTPMNCEEVLKSVLEEWKATILQSEGQWWIFRRNEVALSGTLAFRRYVDGQRGYDTPSVNKNIDVLLGGESEGVILAPLFHINTDQETMIDRSYKNASISYKYGFVTSLAVINPNFVGWDGVNFPDWTKSSGFLPLSEDPLGGAKIGNMSASPGPYEYIENATPVSINAGDQIVFSMNFYNYISDGPRARVKLDNGVDPDRYLSLAGTWELSEAFIDDVSLQYYDGSVSVSSEVAPISGDLTIRLYEAREDLIPPSTDLFITYRNVSLAPVVNPDAVIGEIHVATQAKDFTFVPDTQNVFNGDNLSEQYVGGIYRADETTLTTLWFRRGIAESILALPYAATKPFLRIAVEETTRMYAFPMRRYEGSVFGFFNPLSRFTINLLEGYFMPLSWTWDTQANINKVTLGRVINDEIEQEYTLTADYGDTTKVTIK